MAVDGSDIVSHKIDIRARRREGGIILWRGTHVGHSRRMDRSGLLLLLWQKEKEIRRSMI